VIQASDAGRSGWEGADVSPLVKLSTDWNTLRRLFFAMRDRSSDTPQASTRSLMACAWIANAVTGTPESYNEIGLAQLIPPVHRMIPTHMRKDLTQLRIAEMAALT
jgi:hypothetical protein